MKENRSLIKCLVACGAALALVSSLAAQTAMDGAAKVIRVKGLARYMAPGSSWQPIKAGLVLKPGTIVQTGKDGGSYVDIVLNDTSSGNVQPVAFNPAPSSSGAGSGYHPTASQNVVRIWGDTALGIDKLTTMHTGSDVVTETQLDLKQGHITGMVKKMPAASKYEIKLPNGVAGIRGTSYDIVVTAQPDGSIQAVYKVFDGSVVCATVKPDGTVDTKVVAGGQQYNSLSGDLTPISPADQRAFEALLPTLRFQAATLPVGRATQIAIEISETPMSGTGGQNGQGQNNNNQGNQGNQP